MVRLRVYWVYEKEDGEKKSAYFDVSSVQEAIKLLSKLERMDRKGIISTRGGLEIFQNDKWTEYKNDRGEDINEIRELMNESYLH